MGGSQTSSEPSTTCIFWMSRAYVIGSFCLRIRDSKRQFLVKVIYLTENSTYISLSVTHFLMGSLSFAWAICFTLCLCIEHDSKSDWLKKFFGVSFVGRDCEIVLIRLWWWSLIRTILGCEKECFLAAASCTIVEVSRILILDSIIVKAQPSSWQRTKGTDSMGCSDELLLRTMIFHTYSSIIMGKQ